MTGRNCEMSIEPSLAFRNGAGNDRLPIVRYIIMMNSFETMIPPIAVSPKESFLYPVQKVGDCINGDGVHPKSMKMPNIKMPKSALVLGIAPALLVVVALLSQACGGASAPAMPVATATPTPINPQAILQDCGHTMAAIVSYRFRIEHEGGGTPLGQGHEMSLTDVSGEVAVPDKLALDFTGAAGNFVVKGSLIAIGEDVYMTNPLTGEWHAAASTLNPLKFFAPSQGIAEILSQVRHATLISHDGGAFRIGGTLPVSALAPLFGETTPQSSVDVTLTIDKAHLHLTHAELQGIITPTEPDGIKRTITLSNFNEPPDIEAPAGW